MIQNLPKKSILNLFFCMPKQSMSLVKTSSLKRKLKNYYKKKDPSACNMKSKSVPSNASVHIGKGAVVGSTPHIHCTRPKDTNSAELRSVKIGLVRRSALQVASLMRNQQQMDTNIIKHISKQQTETTCKASPASVRIKNKKLFLENIRFQKHYMPILSFFFTSFGPSTTSRRWQHFAAFTETDDFKKSDVNAVSILSPGPFKEAMQSCTENVLGGQPGSLALALRANAQRLEYFQLSSMPALNQQVLMNIKRNSRQRFIVHQQEAPWYFVAARPPIFGGKGGVGCLHASVQAQGCPGAAHKYKGSRSTHTVGPPAQVAVGLTYVRLVPVGTSGARPEAAQRNTRSGVENSVWLRRTVALRATLGWPSALALARKWVALLNLSIRITWVGMRRGRSRRDRVGMLEDIRVRLRRPTEFRSAASLQIGPGSEWTERVRPGSQVPRPFGELQAASRPSANALGSAKGVLSLGHEAYWNGIRTQALRPNCRTIGSRYPLFKSGTSETTWRRRGRGLRASLRASNLEYSFYGSFVNSRNYLKSLKTSASNPIDSKIVQLHVRWLLATYYICQRVALWPSAKLVALLQSGDSAHRRHGDEVTADRSDLLSAGLRISPGPMVSMLSSHYVMQGLANSKMAEGGPNALNLPKLNGPVHASGCSLATPIAQRLSRGKLEREATHRAQDITPPRSKNRRLTPKAHLYHIETQLFKQLKGQLCPDQHVHTMIGSIKKRSYTHIIPIKYSIYCYSAIFLADEIVQLLQQNRPFRQIWDKMIENINRFKQTQIKGIRISCAGRTSKKAAKAKTISAKYGRTSLHVFSAEIDFASKTANTRFGAIGVKVWLAWERSPRSKLGC